MLKDLYLTHRKEKPRNTVIYIKKNHLAGAAPGALKWKSTEWGFQSSINPPLQICMLDVCSPLFSQRPAFWGQDLLHLAVAPGVSNSLFLKALKVMSWHEDSSNGTQSTYYVTCRQGWEGHFKKLFRYSYPPTNVVSNVIRVSRY